MLCSSCGTECTDDLDTCPCCGAPLKKSPVSDDTIPLTPISEDVIAHARKKPVKLDIASILAADPDFMSEPQPDGSEPAQDIPETVVTDNGSKPADSSGSDATADDESDEPIDPREVLLLSLCILLGLAIAAMVVLIIWPNLIPTLFYRA